MSQELSIPSANPSPPGARLEPGLFFAEVAEPFRSFEV